jgi:hypothetical protein
MATAVLESDVAVELELGRGSGADLAPHGAGIGNPDWLRILVDCAVCGGAHPPGDLYNPWCPVEGF